MPSSSFVRVFNEVRVDVKLEFTTSPGGGWVLDFTRLMLISIQVEVEVGVELGNMIKAKFSACLVGRIIVYRFLCSQVWQISLPVLLFWPCPCMPRLLVNTVTKLMRI